MTSIQTKFKEHFQTPSFFINHNIQVGADLKLR